MDSNCSQICCRPGSKENKYLDILFGIRPNGKLGRIGSVATSDYMPDPTLLILADRIHGLGATQMRVERIRLHQRTVNVSATFPYEKPVPSRGTFRRYSN